jgi:hypothetical protein
MKRAFVLCLAILFWLSGSVALAAPSDGLPEDPGGSDIPGTSKFIHLAHQILNLLSTLGIFAVVIAFMVTGYKIACSQDPRARGEAMHALIPISVGAFVAFGARWLASFIKGFAQSI